MIDIAFPRDVEPAVGELDHVYLYNLDDLQSVVLNTRSQRQDAFSSARQIVLKQVEEYTLWHRQRELGPTIQRLYDRYHAIAQDELNRTITKLPNISAAERSHLEELGRRIVNKLLHDPVHALRTADGGHVPQIQYLHALEKLFQLEAGSMTPPPDSSGEGRDEGDSGNRVARPPSAVISEPQPRAAVPQEDTLTPALSSSSLSVRAEGLSTGRGGETPEAHNAPVISPTPLNELPVEPKPPAPEDGKG